MKKRRNHKVQRKYPRKTGGTNTGQGKSIWRQLMEERMDQAVKAMISANNSVAELVHEAAEQTVKAVCTASVFEDDPEEDDPEEE